MSTKKKTIQGVVVSDKMDKTCVIQVDFFKKHKRFKKFVRRSKRVFVEDPTNQAKEGDSVVAVEGKPLSKKKRHSLLKIMETSG